MKKYLTPQNIVIAVLMIGVILIAIVLFTRNRTPQNPAVLKQLQEQQKELETLRKEKEQETQANMYRDSILWDKLTKNDKSRADKLNTITRNTHEKIDRINSDDFTADSIRKLFSEN